MPNPEIDRRCSACGASARQQALFCPQCGKPFAHQEALADTVDLKPPEPSSSAFESADTISIDTAAVAPPPIQARAADSPPSIPSAVSQPVTRAADPRNDDNVPGRVERLRKASSVVIEQAAFDPSLRFLLVTFAIFILFVVLLLLSKFIR